MNKNCQCKESIYNSLFVLVMSIEIPMLMSKREFMQRAPEKPCLNDVTEVGTWRKAVLTVAIVLVALTLLPVWDELAEELGIGLATSF